MVKAIRTLMSVDQLQSRLNTSESPNDRNDSNLAIIDARFYLAEPDRGEQDYAAAHIPGAIYAHLDRDLSGPMTGQNGRHPLATEDAMVQTFSTWGIDERVQVVVYDTASGFIAARAWWMLRYMGHEAAAVLDGGLGAWQASRGALRSGKERREPRQFTPRVQTRMLIRVDELIPDEKRRPFDLLDARAPERFRGDSEPLDPVAGHIPGARNRFCKTNLDGNGRFRDAASLREDFAELETDKLVCYCGSGVTACHNLLALEHAGLSGAKLYAGSWSEWCADPSRGVETGL